MLQGLEKVVAAQAWQGKILQAVRATAPHSDSVRVAPEWAYMVRRLQPFVPLRIDRGRAQACPDKQRRAAHQQDGRSGCRL